MNNNNSDSSSSPLIDSNIKLTSSVLNSSSPISFEDDSKWNVFDYGETKKIKVNGKVLSNSYLKGLSEEERLGLVNLVFDWYRSHGFPYPVHHKEELVRDFKKLCSGSIMDRGPEKFLSNKKRDGMDIVQQFSCEQFYQTKGEKEPSMFEAFNDDETLRAVIENRIVRFGGFFNIHGAMLRQGFRSTRSCATTSNFNCLIAKFFYEKFSNPGDWVFDYSMGFGHRLLSAISCDRNYVGCDPWAANIESGNKIVQFVEENRLKVNLPEIDLQCLGSEKFCPDELKGKFSLAFSSPPYWKKEIYDNHGVNQSTFGVSYEQWIQGWWNQVVSNASSLVKPDGYFGLNIVQVLDGKYSVLQDMISVLNKFGWKEVDRYQLEMSQSHFTKYKKSKEEMKNFLVKGEPIVIFKR